ncbi:MAG: hypothetical protein EXR98_04725 [Gemmataceae bacterium]|nr:hypothetical protein [Gemmataceae bacterium]
MARSQPPQVPIFADEPPREWFGPQLTTMVPAAVLISSETVEPDILAPPAFATLSISFARPCARSPKRPTFGSVIDLENFTMPTWISDSVRFLTPRQINTLEEALAGYHRLASVQPGTPSKRDK